MILKYTLLYEHPVIMYTCVHKSYFILRLTSLKIITCILIITCIINSALTDSMSSFNE